MIGPKAGQLKTNRNFLVQGNTKRSTLDALVAVGKLS